MGKRNAHAYAAKFRRAGAHDSPRRPDVFDRINDYKESDLMDLKNREIACGKAPLITGSLDVGCRARVRVVGPYCWCEGLVVKRDENVNGDPIWTLDMEGAGVACFLSHELDCVES